MLVFDALYPELAAAECRSLRPINNPHLPDATFLFRELYCNEPRCDCRRVLLQVFWAERREVAATINYSFEPSRPPFADEPQVFLDPLNLQTDLADGLIDLFKEMIERDPDYRERLIRHYELWRAAVDDPSHPGHAKVRSEHHDDPNFKPAFRRPAPARTGAPKVGPNQPCVCGSGKKYKKCCRN